MAKIWLTVDGGGTKTEFCACRENGEIVFDSVFGNANYKASSKENVIKNLEDGLDTLLKETTSSRKDIAGTIVALSGLDSETDRKVYLDILKTIGLRENFYLCNDTELVFRSLSSADGICAVAGTGSIACAFNSCGMTARVGGWGAPLSDKGSGYWIGAQVVQNMILFLDGQDREARPIYEKVRRLYHNCSGAEQCILANLSVQDVASITQSVFECAEEGDKYCLAILHRSEEHLASLITTLYEHTGFVEGKDIDIVAAGGLFARDEYFKAVSEIVQNSITKRRVRFLRPQRSPAIDGLNFALRCFPV